MPDLLATRAGLALAIAAAIVCVVVLVLGGPPPTGERTPAPPISSPTFAMPR